MKTEEILFSYKSIGKWAPIPLQGGTVVKKW